MKKIRIQPRRTRAITVSWITMSGLLTCLALTVDSHALAAQQQVKLRKFPYPYQAMIAISSDADHQTLRKFNLIHQFLNTTEETPLGKGLGLDVSDSFFMYNGSDIKAWTDIHHVPLSEQLTYFRGLSTVPYGAAILHHYIHCGWIDTMHSYGDFSMRNEEHTKFRRMLAIRGAKALVQAGDVVPLWVDHGNRSNVDNFGSRGLRRFFNYQKGSVPHTPYYHTDWTIPMGVQFVWHDRHGDVFGRPSMLYPLELPDGQHVWGFWRYTNSGQDAHGRILWEWTVGHLNRELSTEHLEWIRTHHQYSVIAQHLASDNTEKAIPPNAIMALQKLASYQSHGQILVARTSRLLRYNVSQEYVQFYSDSVQGRTRIHIMDINDPVLGRHLPSMQDIRGLTFYVRDPKQTDILLGEKRLPSGLIQCNPSDGQAPSISIRWYDADTKDYRVADERIQ